MADVVRVTVFFHWHNVYKHAREAFHSPGDHGTKGQVDPVDLAEVLTARIDGGELTAIRIYRGIPDNAYDPHGYNATRRQHTAWQKDPRVIVIGGALRYPKDYVHGQSSLKEVKEKGVDVALALDLVTMATDLSYDLAIVMSCDHDLAPAVERVIARRSTRNEGPDVHVASWNSPDRDSPRLRTRHGRAVTCHWLDQQDYWGVTDERNYSNPTPADHAPKKNNGA